MIKEKVKGAHKVFFKEDFDREMVVGVFEFDKRAPQKLGFIN